MRPNRFRLQLGVVGSKELGLFCHEISSRSSHRFAAARCCERRVLDSPHLASIAPPSVVDRSPAAVAGEEEEGTNEHPQLDPGDSERGNAPRSRGRSQGTPPAARSSEGSPIIITATKGEGLRTPDSHLYIPLARIVSCIPLVSSFPVQDARWKRTLTDAD